MTFLTLKGNSHREKWVRFAHTTLSLTPFPLTMSSIEITDPPKVRNLLQFLT